MAVLACAAVGAIGAFAIPAAGAATPPERHLELVSPADTGDMPILPPAGLTFGILGPGHVVMNPALNPTGETSAGLGSTFDTRRTADGWASSPVHPLSGAAPDTEYYVTDATSDGSTFAYVSGGTTGVLFGFPEFGQKFPGTTSIVVRDRSGTTHTVRAYDLYAGRYATYAGMAADGGRVLYSANVTSDDPATPAGVYQAYQWSAADGSTTPLGLQDQSDELLSECGTSVASAGPFVGPYTQAGPGAVDRDADAAYLQSPAEAGPCGDPQLYLRHGDRTIAISAPEPDADGAGAAPKAAIFVGATSDGRVATFLSSGRLTADDGNDGQDLYRATWDGSTGRTLDCLSCAGDRDTDAQVVGTTAEMSADGSHVYFLSTKPIDGQGVPTGERTANLFVAHDGRVDLVETVTSRDVRSFSPLRSIVRTTPSGHHVAFLNQVTPAANAPRQLYRATVGADGVGAATCVSCLAGVAGAEDTDVNLDTAASSLSPATFGSRITGIPRVMSDDGDTILFTSTSPLAPGAAPGKINLFVWEDGTTRLVAGGAGAPPTLFGMTPDGSDLFFVARGGLTPDAVQATQSLYTLRTGEDVRRPGPPPAPCSGDACRPAATAPSVGPAPGSDRAGTVGNATPPKETPKPPAPKLKLARPAASALRAAASSGRLRTTVRVTGSGTLGVRARARIGRTTRTVASRTTRGAKDRTVRVDLRLSTAARKQLRRTGRLRVTLSAALKGATTSSVVLNLAQKRG